MKSKKRGKEATEDVDVDPKKKGKCLERFFWVNKRWFRSKTIRQEDEEEVFWLSEPADGSPRERNESSHFTFGASFARFRLFLFLRPAHASCCGAKRRTPRQSATFYVIFRTSKSYAILAHSPDINNFVVVIHAKPAGRDIRSRVELLLKFLLLLQHLLDIWMEILALKVLEVAGRVPRLWQFCDWNILFCDNWFLFLVQLGSIVGIFDGFWIGWRTVAVDGLIDDERSRIYCIAVCFRFCTVRCWHLPKVNVIVLLGGGEGRRGRRRTWVSNHTCSVLLFELGSQRTRRRWKKRSKDRRDVSSKSSATKTRKKSSSRPTQAHESVIDLNISFAFYLTNFPTHRIAMIRTRGLYVNREASQREARETTRSRSNRKSRARKRHKSNIGD